MSKAKIRLFMKKFLSSSYFRTQPTTASITRYDGLAKYNGKMHFRLTCNLPQTVQNRINLKKPLKSYRRLKFLSFQ